MAAAASPKLALDAILTVVLGHEGTLVDARLTVHTHSELRGLLGFMNTFHGALVALVMLLRAERAIRIVELALLYEAAIEVFLLSPKLDTSTRRCRVQCRSTGQSRDQDGH